MQLEQVVQDDLERGAGGMEMSSMNRKARTVGAVGAIGLAAMLGLGAVAYACSAQAVIRPNKTSAPAGATVTGSGGAFNRTLVQPGTPVNIRWNSTTAEPLWSGPSDAKGNISFSIRIPDVAAGHYSIVATQGTMVGRAPFEVVGSSASGTGGGSTGSGAFDASQGTQGDTSGDTSQSTNAAADNAGPTNNPETNRTGEPRQTSSTAASSEASQSRSGAETATSSASPAAARSAAKPSTANRGPTRPGTRSVPAGSPTAATSAPESAAPVEAAAPSAAPETAGGEPKRVGSVAGDLWSGFDSGSTASLMPAEADLSSSTGSFAAGVGLLGAGMVAMSAGLAVTVARRRRVLAET